MKKERQKTERRFFYSKTSTEASSKKPLTCNGQSSATGFTLVELLIVMGILVVMAMALKFFPIDYFYEKSLADDAAKIAFMLRATRDKSITQDSGGQWGAHFVNPASGVGYYNVFMGTSYAGGSVVSTTTLNETSQFVSPPSASSTDVLFAPVSGLPSGAGSIILSIIAKPATTKTITIMSSGQVQY